MDNSPPKNLESVRRLADKYADELTAQFRTLSLFVGHAGEVGRAHEVFLRGVIQRFLPGKLRCGSGFVASAILGHSMGGLVARSACHYGELAQHSWRQALGKLICLGSPHHGAPLERGGNWIDVLLGVTRYSAPLARLGQIRSAGVTDMRFGNVLDEHWEGRGRFEFGRDRRAPLALPEGVSCYAVAATKTTEPAARLASDGMVPVNSALGRCDRAALTLAFPDTHQWIAFGTGHLDLLDRPEVYAKLRSWLAERDAVGRAR